MQPHGCAPFCAWMPILKRANCYPPLCLITACSAEFRPRIRGTSGRARSKRCRVGTREPANGLRCIVAAVQFFESRKRCRKSARQSARQPQRGLVDHRCPARGVRRLLAAHARHESNAPQSGESRRASELPPVPQTGFSRSSEIVGRFS